MREQEQDKNKEVIVKENEANANDSIKVSEGNNKEDQSYFKSLSKEQKRRLYFMFSAFFIVFAVLLVYFCTVLNIENSTTNKAWSSYLKDTPEQAKMAEELSKDAQVVTVGTYIENLRRIDIKNSEFRVEMMIWFSWKGDPDLDPANNFRVYKGAENKRVLLEEIHENGRSYQLVGLDVTVSKNYHTMLFPLESHQLRVYVESNHPIQEVRFEPDHVNSGINKNLTVTGYDFKRFAVGGVTNVYDTTHGNPTLQKSEVTSETVTALEIGRTDFGLYFKCFIALYATLVWMLISLYICTYHHVNPLSMIPGALFGAVGNMMIGNNLLPDATAAGLLEFGNIWGAIMILGGTIAIISVNRVRELQDLKYAKFYGKFLFYIVLIFSLLGQILLPLFAAMIF